MFSTLMDHVIVPPASTEPWSGVFVTLMSGHWTTTDAPSLSVPSLLVETLAVLEIVPQSVLLVWAETWTLKLAPAARLALVQARTSVPTGPVIEQPAPPVIVPSVQSTPPGSGSLTAIPRVVWVPPFVTVTSNPIASPAFTGPTGLAVFEIWIVAGATKKHSVSVSVCFAARYSAVA